MISESESESLISQDELDNLLKVSELIAADQRSGKSLVEEIKEALLDSGKLELHEWQALRSKLREIEALIPHIDFIIQLKEESTGRARKRNRARSIECTP